MKKYTITFSGLMLVIMLYSCNESSRKGNNSSSQKESISDSAASITNDAKYKWIDKYLPCREAGGLGNFLIKKEVADKMIAQFDLTYNKDRGGRPIPALQKNYWVDANTIKAIVLYFKSQKKFDGIRFHFGAATINDDVSYGTSPFKNKTSLFLFPTVKKIIETRIEHRDYFRDQTPPLPGQSQSAYLPLYSHISSQIAVYDRKYYNYFPSNETTGISLSKSVWVDSCVIYFMADLLINAVEPVDGFNIKAAAYLGESEGLPAGAYPNLRYASTIIIVPTSPGYAGDRSNWTIIPTMIDKKPNFFNALNHGELCPKKCPPADE